MQMGATKGNSLANIGYGCEQRELIKGWRQIWSETPGTTDPLAPFGVVTLASSGTEGGPDIGIAFEFQNQSTFLFVSVVYMVNCRVRCNAMVTDS